MKNVIHIYGAAGSRTSTLGRKISEELGYKFMDTDDYFWLPTYVLNSSGLYALQEYENVLKKEYPEQILDKYRNEVNKMAVHMVVTIQNG